MSPGDPVIRARQLHKRFGARHAVEGLDLDVPPGICFGLLGPNGAGKTTALRMIYGVTRPSEGSIQVFGLDVTRHARAVRARLGVTLQENVQIEALSPRDNLRVFARHHLLKEPLRSRRVEELLDFLELRSHADVPVVALSGGYRRRLAIAMSLIHARSCSCSTSRPPASTRPCASRSGRGCASCASAAARCSSPLTTWTRRSACATAC